MDNEYTPNTTFPSIENPIPPESFEAPMTNSRSEIFKSFGLTFVFAIIVFSISSCLGLLYGIRESIHEKAPIDSKSFTYGMSILGILTVFLTFLWTLSPKLLNVPQVSGKEYFYMLISAVVFAIAGMGFGGMMGYRNALTDSSDKKFEIALIMLPIITLISSYYLHAMATTSQMTSSTHKGALIVLGAFYITIGALFFETGHFKQDTDEKLYWGYTWTILIAGCVMVFIGLMSLMMGNK